LSKPFKFAELFTSLGVEKICPSEDTTEHQGGAFRWTIDPLDHPLNFLPNIIYDKLRQTNAPSRINDKADKHAKCKRCALSFFSTEEAAKAKFLTIKESSRLAIGYTHIATGDISKNDGLAGLIKQGHFNFYEYQGTDFVGKFTNINTLI
jgi:hypothetical protein